MQGTPEARQSISTGATTGLSIAALLLLWIVAAALTDDAQILPQPWALIQPFLRELTSGELSYHLGATLLRVIWAFSLAMLAGCALGLVMGRYPRVNQWLDPWLVIFLNLPALVLIVAFCAKNVQNGNRASQEYLLDWSELTEHI